jgi:hypothetical protein
MRFESQEDLLNEEQAIVWFCEEYNLNFKKLEENDVDFVLMKNEKIVAYAEVKGRNKNLNEAYPLPIAVRKLVKLVDKKNNPLVIWSCLDGFIYGKVKKLVGEIKIGGRVARNGAVNDVELMAYYKKCEALIEHRPKNTLGQDYSQLNLFEDEK